MESPRPWYWLHLGAWPSTPRGEGRFERKKIGLPPSPNAAFFLVLGEVWGGECPIGYFCWDSEQTVFVPLDGVPWCGAGALP